MTTEQLNKAQELLKQISKLNEHKAEAQLALLYTRFNGKVHQTRGSSQLEIGWSSTTQGYFTLRPEFIPIKDDHILRMYISAIDEEIIKLTKEFENL